MAPNKIPHVFPKAKRINPFSPHEVPKEGLSVQDSESTATSRAA